MAKTVVVDQDTCISCGLCISLAPGIFRFEPDKSFAYNPSGAPETEIQQCIDSCPVEAILWRED